MRVQIEKSKAKGTVSAPPSKSMAHRHLIGAFLSGEKCEIENISFSQDINATIKCLENLGGEFSVSGNKVTVERKCFKPLGELDCNESGSTLRFLIPLALLTGQPVTFKGAERLFQRPLGIYEEICKNYGFTFNKTNNSLTVKGNLSGGTYVVPGDISSQFITGLLYALPLCKTDSIIKVLPPFESKSYVDLTLSSLSLFGIEIKEMVDGYFIKGNQSYKKCNCTVEADMSNAAFLYAFNLLGGDVTVTGINENSLQGDKVYKEIMDKMKDGFITVDTSNCPDLVPVLMAMASVNYGAEFTGTKRLKLKESDRGQVMKTELEKLGGQVEVYENNIIVKPCVPKENISLCGHNDHRIVMSMALLLTLCGGVIEGADAADKSFPDFFEKICSLGIKLDIC